MRDKYKPRQAVESQERAKWTTTEDEFIIKAEQRFTGHVKWVKIAKLLPGRSNIDVYNRWHNSLWNYERTHPDYLQGHTTVLVKHFVSEDHDGMNLSGLYRKCTYDKDGAPIYIYQLDNQQVVYIRRHENKWFIQLDTSVQYSSKR